MSNHFKAILVITVGVIIAWIAFRPGSPLVAGLFSNSQPLDQQQLNQLLQANKSIDAATLLGKPGLHYLNAGNLIGTLSVDRYSAYDDLVDEGKIPDGSKLITDQDEILGDAQNDDGDEVILNQVKDLKALSSSTISLTIANGSVTASVIQSGLKTSLLTNDADFLTNLLSFTTDNLEQGSSNLYSQWRTVMGGISYGSTVTLTSTLRLSQFTTNGGLIYTNATGQLAQLAAGTAGQCLKSSGAVPTWGTCAASNTITGLGVDSYLAKFNGTDDLVSSLVFDDGSNVGIGTASPAVRLDVNGIIRGNSTAQLSWLSYSSNAPTVQVGDSGYGLSSSGGILHLYGANTGFSFKLSNNTELVTIDNNGDVEMLGSLTARYFYPTLGNGSYISGDGYGMVVNGNYLHAAGAGVSLFVENGAAFRSTIFNDTGPSLIFGGGTADTSFFDSKVGINTDNPQNYLDIAGAVAIGSYAGANAAPTNGAIISGNLGIGTANPAGKLEIVNETGGTTPSNYLQLTSTTANDSNYPGISFKGGTYATAFPLIASGNGGLAMSLWSGTSATYPNQMVIGVDSGAAVITFGKYNAGYAQFAKFDVDGNFGINTLTPQNKLDVSGGVAIGSYAGANTAPANGLIVSGYIGIGTSSAAAQLSLAESLVAAGGMLFGSDTNLYRTATNSLKTDDLLIADGGLRAGTSSAFQVDTNGHISRVGGLAGTSVSIIGSRLSLAYNASRIDVANSGGVRAIVNGSDAFSIGGSSITINSLNITGHDGSSVLRFANNGSANQLTIGNAAAASSPTIAATGTDSNIGINITPKGTGNTSITTGSLLVPSNLLVNGAGNPGGSGVNFTYSVSAPNTGPSLRWSDGTNANTLGFFVDGGMAYQGNGSNAHFLVRDSPGDGSLGTIRAQLGGTSTADSYFNGGNVGIGTAIPTSAKLDIISTGTTTHGTSIVANSLTSGRGLNISSTSTAMTTGGLLGLSWVPGSATVSTGDLLSLNVGPNGTVGNLLNLMNDGLSVFSVSQTQITANVPVAFMAAGDMSVAYDLSFTNNSNASIKSSGPLRLQAGETFNSSDLTLGTYNNGVIMLDSGVVSTANNTRLGLGGVYAPTARLALVAGTTADDGIVFGTDTNLYRSAADTLKTDDLLVVGSLQIGNGAVLAAMYSATDTWDPDSLNTTETDSTTLTVTGAVVGDLVTVSFTQVAPDGVVLTGQVSAADTVRVTLLNTTGSPVDLSSGTIRVQVNKF